MDSRQVNAQFTFVPSGKAAQDAFESQCGNADRVDECLGVSGEESGGSVAPSDFKNLHKKWKHKRE